MNKFTPERQWLAPGVAECWTCTDHGWHQHRWYLTAWACAKFQQLYGFLTFTE
jgi:hypothetical protein